MVTSFRRGLMAGGVSVVTIASGGVLAMPAQAATAGAGAWATVVDSGTVQFTAAVRTTNRPVRGDRAKVRCTTTETIRWIQAAVGDRDDTTPSAATSRTSPVATAPTS